MANVSCFVDTESAASNRGERRCINGFGRDPMHSSSPSFARSMDCCAKHGSILWAARSMDCPDP